MIPFIDLKAQYLSLKKEMDTSVQSVIDRTAFINGEELLKFEKEFASYCGRKHCIGVDNGTAAIFIALKCLGLKESDEVIVPVHTFIATAEGVRMCGARPVFVDIDDSGLIDVSKIEEKITKKTKAIIPVHLYGNVCDMDKIIDIAKKHNLMIVEDCAQAHGSTYKGKRVPISDVGCFSFFPGKNLGAYGDAGGIVTDNESLCKKINKFSDHGRSEKYLHDEEGFNFRLDNLQAAILNVKLPHLDEWLNKKRKIAEKYDLSFSERFDMPIKKKEVNHSYHLYVLLHKERDKLKKYLESKGISSGIHYPVPLHLQPALSYLGYKKGDFPIAEKFASQVLSLPIYAELSDEMVNKVISSVLEFD